MSRFPVLDIPERWPASPAVKLSISGHRRGQFFCNPTIRNKSLLQISSDWRI
jgi:hypothetical protein